MLFVSRWTVWSPCSCDWCSDVFGCSLVGSCCFSSESSLRYPCQHAGLREIDGRRNMWPRRKLGITDWCWALGNRTVSHALSLACHFRNGRKNHNLHFIFCLFPTFFFVSSPLLTFFLFCFCFPMAGYIKFFLSHEGTAFVMALPKVEMDSASQPPVSKSVISSCNAAATFLIPKKNIATFHWLLVACRDSTIRGRFFLLLGHCNCSLFAALSSNVLYPGGVSSIFPSQKLNKLRSVLHVFLLEALGKNFFS